MIVKPLDRPGPSWVMNSISQLWGGEPLISASGAHKLTDLSGLGAFEGDEPLGFLHYRIDDDGLEVVTLSALGKERGVGRALVEAATQVARTSGCNRLWLMTTSDNPNAITFYERLGMVETRRIAEFSKHVREIKPEADGTYDAVMLEFTP
jgi:GNAT superfamily N-acetyltransferase